MVQGRRAGVHLGCLRVDSHRLLHIADLHRRVGLDVLVGLKQDAAPLIFAESWLLHGQASRSPPARSGKTNPPLASVAAVRDKPVAMLVTVT